MNTSTNNVLDIEILDKNNKAYKDKNTILYHYFSVLGSFEECIISGNFCIEIESLLTIDNKKAFNFVRL